MSLEDINACFFCRKVTDDERDEDVGVKSPHGPTICLGCAASAVLAAYSEGFRSESLEKGLPSLFEISAQAEAEILAERSEELSARYQKRLMSARDPDPSEGEGDLVSVGFTVTRYTKKRLEALANEASVSVSSWLRQAIWLAFEATKHTDRRDATRDA
jgi:hypothetical protein